LLKFGILRWGVSAWKVRQILFCSKSFNITPAWQEDQLKLCFYLHRTSIAWTCWIGPHGSGRMIWHLYSPVSSACRSDTCSVLLGSILIRGGDTNLGLLESATSWFSHHHRTVLWPG
jgi:hypothetical protein